MRIAMLLPATRDKPYFYATCLSLHWYLLVKFGVFAARAFVPAVLVFVTLCTQKL